MVDNNDDAREQFLEEVFPAELRVVKVRQTAALGEVDAELATTLNKLPPNPVTPVEPTTEFGLVGLAFSGGGIRSAAFNLGIIQALADGKILKFVDYLSTVSGGGYIGSCLSSLLNSSDTKPEGQTFPLRRVPGKEESSAVQHLRNSSNYLAPSGALDKIRIPALMLRGVLVNLLVLIPWLVLAILATNFLYGDKLREIDVARTTLPEIDVAIAELPKINAAITLPGIVVPTKEALTKLRETYVAKTELPNWSFYQCTPWVTGVFLLWVVVFPIFERLLLRGRNWNHRNWYEKSFAVLLLALVLVIVWESLPQALLLYRRLAKDEAEFWTWVAAVASLVPYLFAGSAAAHVSKWTGKLGLILLGLLGPFILLLIFLPLGWYVIEVPDKSEFLLLRDWLNIPWLEAHLREVIVYGAAFLLFLYNLFYVNVNSNSLHRFYRDRLSRAFLIKTAGEQSVRLNDNQRLAGLNKDFSQAPYHLLNVALNLQGSDDPNLRGRNADFFIFSKCFTGGGRTGYCRTDALEKSDRHVDLGTAMAISGAAAAPNMGTTTIKPLVFIMALINIRLGYWLPNPRRIRNEGYRFISSMVSVGPTYLLKELFSRVHSKSLFVNVSDGGHLENLAIYELLRRRCKFIICGDAEADPRMSFKGLATLIRFARIDMGIDVDIDAEELKINPDGLSEKHCALGTIHYGDGETGYLLYVKSSVTGDEDVNVQEYRNRHPSFPHETTADQFFDEAQFEAYRSLGYHIVKELLEVRSEEQDKPTHEETLVMWFEVWKSYLKPRLEFEGESLGLHKQLSSLEQAFREAEYAEYTNQIFPELECATSGDKEADERLRKVFHMCQQQMQLMENVFLARKLDSPRHQKSHVNRGWMNVFRRWAQAGRFRWFWAISIGNYSVSFQTFCERALKLRSEISWEKVKRESLTHREKEHLKEQKKAGRYSEDVIQNSKGQTFEYQLWQAKITVPSPPKKAEGFPVGLVTIRRYSIKDEDTGESREVADIMFVRIRDYYRQMRMLENILPKLKDTLCSGTEKPQVRFVFSKDRKKDQRKYSSFYKRLGFEIEIE